MKILKPLKKKFLSFLTIFFFAAILFLWLFIRFNNYNLKFEGNKSQKDFFKSAKLIDYSKYIKVKNSAQLNPQVDNDFSILFWFKAKNTPATGTRMPILYKFNQENKKEGFALSISNYNNTYRPEIYWNNEADEGRWFSFNEINLKQKNWNAFLISFTENKYLGLHFFTLNRKGDVISQNLGGYLVENIIASSEADLEFGSVGNKTFSGLFGNLLIINKSKGELELINLIKRIAESPEVDLNELREFSPVVYINSSLQDDIANSIVNLESF